jgi:hypothetical protein
MLGFDEESSAQQSARVHLSACGESDLSIELVEVAWLNDRGLSADVSRTVAAHLARAAERQAGG